MYIHSFYRTYLFLILLLVSTFECAHENDKNLIRHYNILKDAKSFSYERVGFAGVPSRETLAFKYIFEHPYAKILFTRLIKEGNSEGKLYVLSGLYVYDHALYNKYIHAFSNLSYDVTSMQGCVKMKESLNRIIAVNDPKIARLHSNKETMEEWIKRAGKYYKTGYLVDFKGGGIPSALIAYIKTIKQKSRISD